MTSASLSPLSPVCPSEFDLPPLEIKLENEPHTYADLCFAAEHTFTTLSKNDETPRERRFTWRRTNISSEIMYTNSPGSRRLAWPAAHQPTKPGQLSIMSQRHIISSGTPVEMGKNKSAFVAKPKASRPTVAKAPWKKAPDTSTKLGDALRESSALDCSYFRKVLSDVGIVGDLRSLECKVCHCQPCRLSPSCFARFGITQWKVGLLLRERDAALVKMAADEAYSKLLLQDSTTKTIEPNEVDERNKRSRH